MSPFRKSVRIVQIMHNFTHAHKSESDTDLLQREREPLWTGPKMDDDAAKFRSGVPRDIPHGYMAVYVGGERRRFVISTHYLSHRLFKALLKKSEEEFGFEYIGGLTITCEPVLFEHLLWLIATDDPAARTTQLEDLLEFYYDS